MGIQELFHKKVSRDSKDGSQSRVIDHCGSCHCEDVCIGSEMGTSIVDDHSHSSNSSNRRSLARSDFRADSAQLHG